MLSLSKLGILAHMQRLGWIGSFGQERAEPGTRARACTSRLYTREHARTRPTLVLALASVTLGGGF